MRKPLIAANWKMNKSIRETVEFIQGFLPLVKDVTGVDVVLAPPFPSLTTASALLEGTPLRLAAQNVFYEERGAYTGEVSAGMLISAGCSAVIIGHSERRQYFSETDEIVNKKIRTARKHGLGVILCIGESLEEREANKTFSVLERELEGSLSNMALDEITVAYEPIWAIGTGKTATPQEANEAHTFIRDWLKNNREDSDSVRILYGGSVTPENIGSLISEPRIDGALVGGASLNPDSFATIVQSAVRG